MKIGFVGAGRVGKSLAFLFKRAKHEVIGVYSRTQNSCNEFTKFVGNGKTFENLKELAKECEVVFITTNDDSIQQVCEDLSPYLSSEQFVFHCSGLLTTQALTSAKAKGCEVGAMHPIQSIPNPHYGIMNLPQSYFDIQCSPGAELVAERLVKDLKCTPIKILPKEKVYNHLASCMVSNYQVSLFDAALKLYENTSISKDLASQMLSHLSKQTVINLENLGPLRALTGPIMRGDVGTVKKHLKSIKDDNVMILYQKVGLILLKLAEQRGRIKKKQIKQIKNLLENTDKLG